MRQFPLLLVLLIAGALVAADGPRTTVPVEKGRDRHDSFLVIAKAGGVDLLFLGDSITDGWRGPGKSVWDKFFAPLKAANFGSSGDKTEHVIWRLRNGELEGIHPKLAVLMIGVNNEGDSAEDVAAGIKMIIADVQQRSPGTCLLLLAILPRGEKPNSARLKNEQVNKLISAYANASDPKRVVYMDIGDKLLTPDKILSKDIMPDALHPNDKGYQIWAEAIIDMVKQLLQKDVSRLTPCFAKPSASLNVAKIEAVITAGNVVSGGRALEKLATDKDAAVAEAAKASLVTLTAWKESIDAEIVKLVSAGDVLAASEMDLAMGKLYAGDAGKPYKDHASLLKKDPAYTTGKEYQKLAETSYEARKDPRFAKLVEAFVKKYPTGYYVQQAQALVIK